MSSLVGGNPGAGIGRGSAIIDFGPTFAPTGFVAVTGQTAIAASAQVKCWIQGAPGGSNQMLAGELIRVTATVVTPGVGFTIRAEPQLGLWKDQITVQWKWEN